MSISTERLYQRIKFYLNLLKKKIIYEDKEKFIITVEERVDDEPLVVTVVYLPPVWIHLRAKLIDGSEMEKLGGSKYIIYRELLKLSFRSAEFKFAIDDQSNIYITQDIHIAALTFDVFEEEYNAIPAAYKTFHKEIYPEMKNLAETQKIDIT